MEEDIKERIAPGNKPSLQIKRFFKASLYLKTQN